MHKEVAPSHSLVATVIVSLSLVVALFWGGTARAEGSNTSPSVQGTPPASGPHAVSTKVRVDPCQESIVGLVQSTVVRAFGNVDDPLCTAAFPNGGDSPAGVNVYYPDDIAALPPSPLIVFTGGIASNPGMYDALARQWASYGFVVAIPYDWINSLAYVPIAGLATAIAANRDRNSPLYDKVDLGRTIFAGHSAGGGAALQAASLIPSVAGSIDQKLAIVGTLAIEPGPVAVGSTLTTPTLFLTGSADFVVPDFAWVRWWQYNLTFNAPAWIANAVDMSHFAPTDGIDHFPSAGAGLAFVQWLGFGDTNAKKLFVGPDWYLKTDGTFLTAQRNSLADDLR